MRTHLMSGRGHLFNHSTYHRGQVTSMLRLLGTPPATTDFLEFWDEGE